VGQTIGETGWTALIFRPWLKSRPASNAATDYSGVLLATMECWQRRSRSQHHATGELCQRWRAL